jgi:hypothetical protein
MVVGAHIAVFGDATLGWSLLAFSSVLQQVAPKLHDRDRAENVSLAHILRCAYKYMHTVRGVIPGISTEHTAKSIALTDRVSIARDVWVTPLVFNLLC